MDEFELRKIIYDYIKEICHYSQMQVFATSSYQKNYFQLQIDEAVSGLTNLYLVNKNTMGWIQNLREMEQPTRPQQVTQPQPPTQPAQPQPPTQPVQQQPTQQPLPQSQHQRVVTIEELAQNDGSGNRPAYVAVNNEVYDMSQVIQWAGGTHFGLFAGQNLSNEFIACHKGMYEILEKYPKVGILEQK